MDITRLLQLAPPHLLCLIKGPLVIVVFIFLVVCDNIFIPHKGRKKSELGIIYNEPYVNTPDWGLPLEPIEKIGNNTWRIG